MAVLNSHLLDMDIVENKDVRVPDFMQSFSFTFARISTPLSPGTLKV